jgi:hypothetical protein
MVETMAGGLAVFDYDNDGRLRLRSGKRSITRA